MAVGFPRARAQAERSKVVDAIFAVVHSMRCRAQAVDDSVATLRRIERDLHDGTQARLVVLAMNLGLAKEKFAEGGPSEEVLTLLEWGARATAKDAITGVRNLIWRAASTARYWTPGWTPRLRPSLHAAPHRLSRTRMSITGRAVRRHT